jgi:predicted CXXCH cytochrome family protein
MIPGGLFGARFMQLGTRTFWALIICLLFAGLLWIARGGGDSALDPSAAQAALSRSSCRDCHPEVWAQWEQSPHSRSWSDPNVQAAFQHFGFDRKCESCHAPQPVLVAGLSAPAELRDEDRDCGVDCLTCHQLPEGAGVAARRTLPDAPCRPVATPELTAGRMCGTCHDPIFKDWQASTYADEGKTCQGCHMPEDVQGRGKRSHLCSVSRDPERIRSSCRMQCRAEKEELMVSVTNHAAGHNYPGERHHRILLLQVVERDAADEIVLARQEVIKGITPLRRESASDRIRPGATFEARFPIAGRPLVADVRLLYKLFPWQSDREALVVHQAEVRLEK